MTKRKSHYEVLGVDKSADAAQVKRAYRKRAAEVHPDKKDGDAAEMAEVNQAYEVLSDPERRLLYDSTGADRARPFDEEVRNVVLSGFADGLNSDAPDCLAHARNVVEKQLRQIEVSRRDAVNAQKKYTARRGKVTTKGEVNLFHLLIDRQLEQIAQGIAAMDRDAEKFEAALELLKGYETSERVQPRVVLGHHLISFSSSGFDWNG